MGTGQAYTPLRERLHTLLLVSTVGAGALVLFFLRLSAEAGHQIHPSAASAASFNFDLDSVELSTLLEEELQREIGLLVADFSEADAGAGDGDAGDAEFELEEGCEVPSPKRHAVGNLNRSVPIDEITPILGKVKRKLRL